MTAAIGEFRDEYSGALTETSTEVSKLREEFNEDVTALEAKLEERITQVEAAALTVIKEGDKAAEARIDQVFTELRVFVQETLAQITALILPILNMSESISGAVEKGQEHFATVVKEVLKLIAKVEEILTEVQGTIREFTGKNPETGESNGEGLAGLIAGILGTLMAGYTQWRRAQDHKQKGYNQTPEQLAAQTRTCISTAIKSGEFDDEIRGRLVKLGMISTKPNGGEK